MLTSRRSCCRAGIADYFLDSSTSGGPEHAKDVANGDVLVVPSLHQRKPIDYPANRSLMFLVAVVEARMSSRGIPVEQSP